MKFYTYIFLLFFSIKICYSQQHIYKHFGVDEGLPSSEVYDIYQDKKGYVWFATDKGLSRYNGYEFENFTTKDGLPDNTIFDFFPQKNGQMWCYGYYSQSFFYFNTNDFDGFRVYKYNDILKSKIKPSTVLKNVFIDSSGTLITGGYQLSGFISIDKNGSLKHHFNGTKHLSDKYKISKLAFKANSDVFFLLNDDYNASKSFYSIENKGGLSSRLKVVTLTPEKSLFIDRKIGLIVNQKIKKYFNTKPNPIGIKKISDSLFFAGYYNNGAEIRDLKGNIIDTFLPKKSVSNFLVDKEGGYWFCTLDDGIFYIKNPKINILTKDHISSLVKTKGNKLYAGYHNGNIAVMQNNTFKTLYKGLETDNAQVEINSITNEVYGYSDKNFANYTNKEKSYRIGARNIPEAIEDGIISNYGAGFTSIVNGKKAGTNIKLNIQDVCKYNDSVLLGTSFGLYVYKNNKAHKHQPLKILSHRIDDIDLNKNTNTIYIATQGAGVVVYNDSIYNISKKNGLTNDIVSEIHIENDSTIWACSNTGLNRIIFKPNDNFKVTTITKADGLISNDIDDVEITNDTIWVATKKGLCFFKKSFLAEKEASNILSLTLKDVIVNNTSLNNETVKLKYNQNTIDFKLQAISHRNTNKINYLYRLKEVDSSWTSTTNRNVNFPSLSPGNYTFEAKANVSNNPNSHSISYAFKVTPPFWRSWWFYALCLIIFSGIVYLFFKVRVLTYNKDIFRELIRLAIKRLKGEEQFYKFRSNGEDFKIPTRDILFINSQGNYLDITTEKKTHTIRCKIGDFIDSTPDALEYLRLHRSYIVRIDKVSSKGKNWVVVKDYKIPVGETYLDELNKIHF